MCEKLIAADFYSNGIHATGAAGAQTPLRCDLDVTVTGSQLLSACDV